MGKKSLKKVITAKCYKIFRKNNRDIYDCHNKHFLPSL